MKKLTQAERAKRDAKHARRAARRAQVEAGRKGVCQSLEASIRGSYHPDRYFIEMNVDPANNTGTYIHEYWHYLQNISTLHGIKSFLVTQQLLARFSCTMRRDGTSAGDVSFSQGELESLKFCARRGPRSS
jgi:hypothetical protein